MVDPWVFVAASLLFVTYIACIIRFQLYLRTLTLCSTYNTSETENDVNLVRRARFPVHRTKTYLFSCPAWLSLNAAWIDPCDLALPTSQNPSHQCTTSRFDFRGK